MQSIRQNATLVIISALLLGMTGCSFEAPSNETTKAATPATATVAQPEKIIMSASSPTAITKQAVSKGDSGIAPPYEEIKRTIDQIVGRDEQGEGPEVGDDGIVDPIISEAFGNYNEQLKGRKVQDWYGWIGDYTESDLGNPDKRYNLGIFMREPKSGESAYDGALLLNVPQRDIRNMINLTRSFDSIHSTWPQVRFSGTIVGTFHNGCVLLDEVTIRSVK